MLRRVRRFLCRRRQWRWRGKGSWRVSTRAQFAVEFTHEQGAQPGTDVNVALGTEPGESLVQFWLDAELDESTTQLAALKYHVFAQRTTLPCNADP